MNRRGARQTALTKIANQYGYAEVIAIKGDPGPPGPPDPSRLAYCNPLSDMIPVGECWPPEPEPASTELLRWLLLTVVLASDEATEAAATAAAAAAWACRLP